jgi:hypothetical protein
MAQSIAYVLSKNAYPDAYQAKLIGVYQGTQIVYASTSTLSSSNVLYADSRLTQPIYGSPSDWYGVQLLTDDAVRYAVVISTTGSITPIANPTTTSTTTVAPATTSTTTAAPATTTTTSASTTSTTSTAPNTTTTTSGSIDVLFSVQSCTGGTGMTIQFTTGSNLCDSPLVISGDFQYATEGVPFYIRYNGIAKSFLKTSPTTAEGIGGAPNECITC